jgi:hypothetical protein
LKAPRSKFFSNADLKQHAKEHKEHVLDKFSSQMQGSINNPNFNLNYNINQNITQGYSQNGNPRANQEKVLLEFGQWQGQNIYPHVNNFIQNGGHLPNLYQSPNSIKFYSASPNDSGNFSLGDDYNNINFIPMRPAPKRNQSSGNLENKSRGNSSSKIKTSLFMSADKDEKGEDFADLQELMNTITGDLWEYAKTQKGSR